MIINTISAEIELDRYLSLIALQGTMCVVGLPEKPLSVSAFALTGKRRSLAGSNIGGIAENQEMLNFCAEHGFGSDVEVIAVQQVNEAWERVLKSDVRYRFVIDTESLTA